MPSRNVIKIYAPQQYYHVYNRGVNKAVIFHDDSDYAVFLNLLKRYLGKEQAKDRFGRIFPSLSEEVELLAFCLMPNHFHLCFYLKSDKGIENLMRGLGTAYTTYFNKKYKRVGTIFQGVYKASHISSDQYLRHITRYIHLNPRRYRAWPYSSLPYYSGERQADWLQPQRILALFDTPADYLLYAEDYEGQKELLDELKHELANGHEF